MLTDVAVLDRDWILRHIPHRGRMCLLDEVLRWDRSHIECASRSHLAADHPLRAHGRLGAVCGVEYAAQAMAVHGALLERRPAPGMLASVRGLTLLVERLDDIEAVLRIRCERIHGDAGALLYRFELLAQERALLHGRASIVLGSSA